MRRKEGGKETPLISKSAIFIFPSLIITILRRQKTERCSYKDATPPSPCNLKQICNPPCNLKIEEIPSVKKREDTKELWLIHLIVMEPTAFVVPLQNMTNSRI